jgi:hypothetical protein
VPQFEYTPAGVINQDEDDGMQAAGLVAEMIGLVRVAKSKGGFEPEDILFLVEHWVQIGEVLRSRQYNGQLSLYWFTGASDLEAGKKASDKLLEVLQKFSNHAMDRDAESHALYFNDAQDAMRPFVHAYRAALHKKDPDGFRLFDGKLRHLVSRRFL